MAGIQLSGLSSGLDTDSIISALIASERLPQTQLKLRQAADQARQGVLQTVQTKLRALSQASSDLSSVLTWSPAQTVTSSDDSRVGARLTSGAAPGGYTVQVSQLATSTQRTYAYAAQSTNGSVTINGVSVTIAAGANVDAVAAAINGAQGTGVVAVNVGGSLVLASTATGSPSAVNVSGAGFTEDPTKAQLGQDAKFSINGGPTQTSASNIVSAATVNPTSTTNPPATVSMPVGLELTLKGLSSGTGVNVSAPAVDQTGVQAKVKAFVDAYNDAMGYLRARVTERPVTNAQNAGDAAKGVLYGDAGLEGLMDNLRRTVGSSLNVAGNPSTIQTLADIGVSTGATTGGGAFSQDAVAGKLVLDAGKLTQALTTAPQSVQRLLGATTGVSGFAQAFGAGLSPYAQAGGILDGTLTSMGNELHDLAGQISDWDTRLQRRQDSLRTMFTNMETALAKTKAQGNNLLARLGYSNG